MDAKGQQSAIRADGIEDFSVRLDALVDGPLVKELHIGGEWFGPWCAGGLVGQKFAERAMQECECKQENSRDRRGLIFEHCQ